MRWEYRVEEAEEDFLQEPFLNELGQEGWELVSVDNGIAYFKRPDVEANNREWEDMMRTIVRRISGTEYK